MMAEKEPIRYKAAVRNNDSGVASVSWGGGFPAQVQFSQGVSVDTGGGFTGHAWWAARCMDTNHPDTLPGVLPDGTWKGDLRESPGRAFQDAGQHSDGEAYVVRNFGGTEVGPINPS
jgi:hypothetical protein